MDQSSVMRQSTTIAKWSRSGRRRSVPFVVVLGLAALSWALIILACLALSAWLT